MNDKFTKDIDQRLNLTSQEAYCKGRKESAEEMLIENRKLREIIDSLRLETSQKSKRVIEMQFELEELAKYKKKSLVEIEELYSNINKEREG